MGTIARGQRDPCRLRHLNDGGVSIEQPVARTDGVAERTKDVRLANLAVPSGNDGIHRALPAVSDSQALDARLRKNPTNAPLNKLSHTKARRRALERVRRDENGRLGHRRILSPMAAAQWLTKGRSLYQPLCTSFC